MDLCAMLIADDDDGDDDDDDDDDVDDFSTPWIYARRSLLPGLAGITFIATSCFAGKTFMAMRW